ncbi:FAD/NAD(P)-binding domain-containing protein [Cadophora sp. DSE1049]|nr:FAD/NAD(P)-binding domain-containing protein [Cadophora sp. DSE1049]
MAANLYTLPSLPCALPTVAIPEDIDLASIASQAQKSLSNLKQDDFLPDAIWRDSFALTGTLRTFYSAADVFKAWTETSVIHRPGRFTAGPASPRVVRTATAAWIEMPFTFETSGVPGTICSGFASMTMEGERWKIWVLRTILEGLKGEPNVDVLEPVAFAGQRISNGSTTNRATTNGATTNGVALVNGNGNGNNYSNSPKHYGCVIIGGGQAGLSTGGRLKALGVSYVVLEKHDEIGDNWKTRYDSTKLHTIREFAHLPFDRTFPERYPEFLTKDDLAEGYINWTKKYGINVMLSTSLTSGSWDQATEKWTLQISTRGEKSTITTSNVVFAVGVGSQVPVKPVYKNEAAFKGTALHSVEYKNPQSWKGKHGVVVGTANTAHDVAEDMLAAGLASVTMVQRTPTYVVPAEYYAETHESMLNLSFANNLPLPVGLKPSLTMHPTEAYNAVVPTEVADRMYFTNPSVLGRIMSQSTLLSRAAQQPERFEALERAGFQLDKHGDMFYYLFQRFGGHYMDVGASAKISKGLIKIKSDALPVAWTEDGLLCADGSRLPADVVVCATGFVCNLKLLVAELFGPEIAASLDDMWGLDEEGEIKGAFKPCGHPAFWFHGGAVGQARYFARFIALQVKARLLGTPLPLYEATRQATKVAVL